MNVKYKSYRQDKKAVGKAAVLKIVGEKVPEGYVLEITHQCIADLSNKGELLEVGYVDLAGEDRILIGTNNVAKYECHLTGHAFIEAGEAPFGRVTTADTDDVVIFSCHGQLWPKC